MNARTSLQQAAARIAARHDRPTSGPWHAFSKLFIAPRWAGDGIRASGLRRWKPGELLELVQAIVARDWPAAREELGDVGYYVAQSWDWLWWLYEHVTTDEIVASAVAKFERRAHQP